MTEKIGRNDPCPCGSGKKYKSCCWGQAQPGVKKKFKATLISRPSQQNEQQPGEEQAVHREDNLMERIYGNALHQPQPFQKPMTEENSEKEKAPE